jgi:hypothetical protein
MTKSVAVVGIITVLAPDPFGRVWMANHFPDRPFRGIDHYGLMVEFGPPAATT